MAITLIRKALPMSPEITCRIVLPRRQVLALLTAAIAATGSGSRALSAPWSRDPAPPSASPDQNTFLRAVQAGDLTTVTAQLDADATLATSTDASSRSAFILAHLHGHRDVAELLVRRGIELDMVEAVLAADWPRVEALAAAHPESMSAAHPIGGTPLYASALVGGTDQYRLRALGAASDARPAGGSGFTPARAAMDCRDPVGAWLAATDILSNGGDPNAPQAGGDSVLHGAVRARDLRLVRLVLRKGGDPAARDAAGRTPLKLAQILEWQAGVDLLQHDALIARDCRDSRFAFNASRERFTLETLADVPAAARNAITGVSHFNARRVQALLAENPLLIHAISSDAELAIEACGHTGQRDIIRLHLDRGAPLSLPTALSLGDLDHARWLLQGNPRLVHERGPHDFPVMWYPAIGAGSVEAAALLLAHGADLEQDSGGETALHWAASHDQPDLLRFLLDEGANPQALSYRQDRAGQTPLQLAVAKGKAGAARMLRAAT